MRYGFAVFAGTPQQTIRALAREAEQLGYSSFWVNYPGPIDGLAALAPAAQETQRIDLGVGVAPLDKVGPDKIEHSVRTHALPLDRLLLGVGSPTPGALRRMRDGIQTLRSRLHVRLIAAAMGPQMCRLAGEIADGVLFNWITSDHARRSAGWVRTGAEAAGRPSPKLFAYVRLALGSTAAERLAGEAARYGAIPAYAAHFARMAVKPADTAIVVDSEDELRSKLLSWQGAVDELLYRAITGQETTEAYLALLRAARPQ
jgi:alkanesulfonate monooxygenase SsuD/methylene tetrahydromethanopterin reductase-like flavin-dependent oxidoreductase (luciferase family)